MNPCIAPSAMHMVPNERSRSILETLFYLDYFYFIWRCFLYYFIRLIAWIHMGQTVDVC